MMLPDNSAMKLRGTHTSPAKTKLLVVDDQPINIQAIYQIFQNDYDVFMATNGAQALEIVRQNPAIDVVLTDFAMPRMTGRDLAIAIAREKPGLPVILATGFAELPPGESFDAKMLQKPFGLAELARVLKR